MYVEVKLAVDNTLMACLVPQKFIENAAVGSSATTEISPTRGLSKFRLGLSVQL